MLEKPAAVLRCVCGRGISVELRYKCERLVIVTFFDDETTSATRGERVNKCPGCDVGLGIHRLSPRILTG